MTSPGLVITAGLSSLVSIVAAVVRRYQGYVENRMILQRARAGSRIVLVEFRGGTLVSGRWYEFAPDVGAGHPCVPPTPPVRELPA